MALRSGMLRAVLPVDLPYILGWDVSGTIVEVGDDVEALAVGDRVIGRLDAGGAAAEYVAAPAGMLAKAPVTAPLADAAAIPVAALTAWQVLFERLTSPRASACSSTAPVAAWDCSPSSSPSTQVRQSSPRPAAAQRRGGPHDGADHIIDYTTTALADALDGPVDAVVNLAPISPEAAVSLVSLLRPGGVIASVATPVEPAADADVTALHMVARNDAKQLGEIVGLLDVGALIVDVAESLPLSNLALVHRRSQAGQTHGKIIIFP